jgi:hypothetical protein
MNTHIESNKSDLLNIPVLSSRWKALAITTALLTIVVNNTLIGSERAPDWLANLPAITAIGYVLLMGAVAFGMVRLIGRWVMWLIARGTNVEAFCRPDFVWAFLLTLLISVLDSVTLLIIEVNANQVGAFMGVCLTFFAGLSLLNVVGFYGWLTTKPTLTADFWRKLAAIHIGLAITLLASVLVASSTFHTWVIDVPLALAGFLSWVLAGAAHILYANSAAFSQPLGSKVDRALSNFNYATTDQDFRTGKYI